MVASPASLGGCNRVVEESMSEAREDRRLFDEQAHGEPHDFDVQAAQAELELRRDQLDAALESNRSAQAVSEATLKLQFKV